VGFTEIVEVQRFSVMQTQTHNPAVQHPTLPVQETQPMLDTTTLVEHGESPTAIILAIDLFVGVLGNTATKLLSVLLSQRH
jgi:hypothetical protein